MYAIQEGEFRSPTRECADPCFVNQRPKFIVGCMQFDLNVFEGISCFTLRRN